MSAPRSALGLACVMLLVACQPRGGNFEIATAVSRNDVSAVNAYLADGGDPDLIGRDGRPLLYLASGPQGGLEVAKALLAAGADPNTRSAEGRTVLQNAASWCDADMVAALLEAGADPFLAGESGQLPVDVVCATPEDRRQAVLALLFAADSQN